MHSAAFLRKVRDVSAKGGMQLHSNSERPAGLPAVTQGKVSNMATAGGKAECWMDMPLVDIRGALSPGGNACDMVLNTNTSTHASPDVLAVQ